MLQLLSALEHAVHRANTLTQPLVRKLRPEQRLADGLRCGGEHLATHFTKRSLPALVGSSWDVEPFFFLLTMLYECFTHKPH